MHLVGDEAKTTGGRIMRFSDILSKYKRFAPVQPNSAPALYKVQSVPTEADTSKGKEMEPDSETIEWI